MQKHADFITNSSSSSYICCISGECESGFDISPSDVGFCECENGHVFAESYKLQMALEELKKHIVSQYARLNAWEKEAIDNANDEETLYNTISEISDDYDDFGDDRLPACLCPICQFKQVSSDDLQQYMLALLKKSKQDLKNEIMNRFKDYDDFQKFLCHNKC